MKLVNGSKASIPEGKLENYCLNPYHPDGKHKARIFEKALGITRENSDELRHLIIQSAKSGTVKSEQKNVFGKTYRVEFEVQGIHQKEILCILWIVKDTDTIPSLTSCFIKTKKRKK